MFRPVTFKPENEYDLVLMRNRREELIDIPIDYIDSIKFSMGERLQEPTEITLIIPSHVQRGNERVALPLYKMIKGKMQLKLTLNDKKYMFSIEEESVTETEDIHEKTLVAYEKFYKFNTVDFTTSSNIATRQLYKDSTEKVEVSSGMLNWFEEQTGWTVSEITDRAKKEVTMCSQTERVDLPTITKKAITDTIFDIGVNISANNNKPLNMKIVMDCTVYDSTDKQLLQDTKTFEFENLPYAISNIKAEYCSTNKNFYGIKFTITYSNGHVSTHEYPFLNCKNLKLSVTGAIQYELGNLVENEVTKYRTFDITATNWMSMLNTIAESFDVIILFDSYNETIKVCHKEEFGERTNIALTYDNALEEITKDRKLDELVTRLTVESSNTSIAGVNVLGTEYVECYDYFIESGIMSEELQIALKKYEELLKQKDVEFNTILLDKHEADQLVTLYNSQLQSLQSKYSVERAILTGYVKEYSDEEAKRDKVHNETGQGSIINLGKKVSDQQAIVKSLEDQVSAKLNELQQAKDRASNLLAQITKIGEDIKKENTGFFTKADLKELDDYLIEKAITDDTHVTAIGVYNYVQEQIKEYQKPVIDFSISSNMEFIERIGRKITDCIFLGAKMEIEDKANDITDADGTVMLYGFTLHPSTNTVSDINFTNGAKIPDSPLKQISKTSQTAKVTKSMTDFYKATLEKVRISNPDVAKILAEGLDLAAQKVRSRTDKNIIEIDEGGIFLIDADNEDEQLALINDLIAMTTDRWKTSKVAISPEGITAELLIGKMIIGEDLYLGTSTNSFKICKDGDAYGMFVFSKDSKDENVNHLRIFLGLDKNKPQLLFFDEGLTDMDDFHSDNYQNIIRVFLGVDHKTNKTIFNMYTKNENGDNQLVVTQNGMFNCYQINDRDSFDSENSFKSYFYIPATLGDIFEAKMMIHLDNFRAYSRPAKSTTINLSTTQTRSFEAISTESGKDDINTTQTRSFEATSTGGSGSIKVALSGVSGSASGVTTSGSSTSGFNSQYGIVYTYPINSGSTATIEGHTHPVNTDSLKHSHNVSITTNSHSHTVKITGTASADTHTHNFTVPTHSHGITLPGHTHKFKVPTHAHDIVMPPHDHVSVYGIYEYATIPTVEVYLNGHKIMTLSDGERDYPKDMKNAFNSYLKRGDYNTLEFKAIKSGADLALARASFTLFWSGYYNYYSDKQ